MERKPVKPKILLCVKGIHACFVIENRKLFNRNLKSLLWRMSSLSTESRYRQKEILEYLSHQYGLSLVNMEDIPIMSGLVIDTAVVDELSSCMSTATTAIELFKEEIRKFDEIRPLKKYDRNKPGKSYDQFLPDVGGKRRR